MHIFSTYYWKYYFSLTKAAQIVLTCLGVLWLFIEVISYFSNNELNDLIRSNWYIFLIISFFWIYFETKPKTRFVLKSPIKDISIEIIIKEPLEIESRAIVIGSNTKFETTTTTNSLSSNFIKKYYSHKEEMDKQIKNELESLNAKIIIEKGVERKVYPIGSIVKLNPNKERKAYFLAIAEKNEFGKSYSTVEYILNSLNSLWQYLIEKGEVEDLAIPLLGTRTAMVNIKKEVLLMNIIQSFLESSSNHIFCPKLIIVISPSDFLGITNQPCEFEKYLQYHFNHIFIK